MVTWLHYPEDHGGRSWHSKVSHQGGRESRQEGLGAVILQKHAGTYFLQLGPAFYTSQE